MSMRPGDEPAPVARPPSGDRTGTLALMLGGGGARGAYQAGVLRGIARQFPDLRFPILTGISAGAVNTIHLASRDVPLAQSTNELVALWMGLTPQRVFDVRAMPLLRNLFRWSARLLSGGIGAGPEPMRGMVDSDPLRQFLHRHLERAADGTLPGIARNLASGALHAVALSATSYANGQSMTWVEGRDIALWQRPQRHSESTRLTVEHVMASSALPMLFPAVQVGDQWFGDGGVRLTSPLSPALHLGATRILTISTGHIPQPSAADLDAARIYPPPAQVLGVLYNSVFLDLVDEDIQRLQKLNRLLAGRAPEESEGMRAVDILVIRPSHDLRHLVHEVEPQLPWFVRYLTRGLGTREATSHDLLSLILFRQDYIRRLVELGEADAAAQGERLAAFLHPSVPTIPPP